jgi:hypothetical protein
MRYRGTKVRGREAPPIASVGRGDPMTPSLRINMRDYILGGGSRFPTSPTYLDLDILFFCIFDRKKYNNNKTYVFKNNNKAT